MIQTLKMDIILLLTQKVKSLFKKKITRQKKKQFHHHKVRYFMQKLQRNPQSPPNPPKLLTKSYLKYCHANILTTI